MKKTIDLVKLQFQIYVKGIRFVMPLIVSLIFLYVMYTIKPQDIVSGFLVSSVFIFLVMVWAGLSVSSGEDTVTEQILLLRVQSPAGYYASKVLFLLCLAFLADILYTGFPVIQNLLNGKDLFTRQILAADVLNALLLQGGSAFAGAALGGLLHPGVMKNRKMAIILTVFLAVLSVTALMLADAAPVMKWILWLLPPVMAPADFYGNAEFYETGKSAAFFVTLVFYGGVYSVLKSMICHRKRFS